MHNSELIANSNQTPSRRLWFMNHQFNLFEGSTAAVAHKGHACCCLYIKEAVLACFHVFVPWIAKLQSFFMLITCFSSTQHSLWWTSCSCCADVWRSHFQSRRNCNPAALESNNQPHPLESVSSYQQQPALHLCHRGCVCP